MLSRLAFALAAVAVITYPFHSLAREVWDPGDAVWYVALGAGCVLLGRAIAGFQTMPADAAPDRTVDATA